MLDQPMHIGDLIGQRCRIESGVCNVTVKRIQGTESVPWIRTAQVLFHLPYHTTASLDECVVNLSHQLNAHAPVVGDMPAQDAQPVKPHGEVVKILTIAIGRLTNADSARTPQYANHFSDQ